MKRQIVLIISLVAGLIAALLTRTYLTVKENEIKAEKAKLIKKYGTVDVLAFSHDTPSGSVLSKADFGKLTVPEGSPLLERCRRRRSPRKGAFCRREAPDARDVDQRERRGGC